MNPNHDNQNKPEWEQIVTRNVKPVNYGSVEIVIHDSKVVQIDTKHKVRLATAAPEKLRGE
jgi:hypothetical protein